MVPNHARYQTALHLGVNDNITLDIIYQAIYVILCAYTLFDTYNNCSSASASKKVVLQAKNSLQRNNFLIYYISVAREHSSAGRAPALQAGGHRFEPCCSHHVMREWLSW